MYLLKSRMQTKMYEILLIIKWVTVGSTVIVSCQRTYRVIITLRLLASQLDGAQYAKFFH